MNRIPLSPAASALLRTLVARARIPRDRILLSDAQSAEWRSLTFAGERHVLHLRVTGAGASAAVERLCDGLEEAEFSIPGMIVADIGVAIAPSRAFDGSVTLAIEALTVEAD